MSTMQDLIKKQKYIKELEEMEEKMQKDLKESADLLKLGFDGIQSICKGSKYKNK